MYVSKLIISGFCSIHYTETDFCLGKNIIVGRNNSGKSNIVKALDILLGVKNPGYADINFDDFHIGADGVRAKEMWMVCKIEGDDLKFEKLKNLKSAWLYVCNEDLPFLKSQDGRIEIDKDVVFFDPEDMSYYKYRYDDENVSGKYYLVVV